MRDQRAHGWIHLLPCLLATALLTSCSDRGRVPTTADNGEEDPVSFAGAVQPILTQNCATSGCHASPGPIAGLDLSAGQAYGNLVGVASGGNPSLLLVSPAVPDSSLIYLKLTAQGASLMPPGGSLPAEEIETVRSWIEEGAADN